MSQLLLKMIFYLTTGVILASISWSTISHSKVTGDYVLEIILLGAMFFIVAMYAVSGTPTIRRDSVRAPHTPRMPRRPDARKYTKSIAFTETPS